MTNGIWRFCSVRKLCFLVPRRRQRGGRIRGRGGQPLFAGLQEGRETAMYNFLECVLSQKAHTVEKKISHIFTYYNRIWSPVKSSFEDTFPQDFSGLN